MNERKVSVKIDDLFSIKRKKRRLSERLSKELVWNNLKEKDEEKDINDT